MRCYKGDEMGKELKIKKLEDDVLTIEKECDECGHPITINITLHGKEIVEHASEETKLKSGLVARLGGRCPFCENAIGNRNFTFPDLSPSFYPEIHFACSNCDNYLNTSGSSLPLAAESLVATALAVDRPEPQQDAESVENNPEVQVVETIDKAAALDALDNIVERKIKQPVSLSSLAKGLKED
jgi:hypothetical protein